MDNIFNDENFIKKVKSFLEDCPKNHSSNSLRNAFGLLDRAKKLSQIDENAAAFLAITAEEEAVSAIFLALKQLGYDSANTINHRNHVHKAAFYPFCQAMSNVLKAFNSSSPHIGIDPNSEDHRLLLRMTVKNFNGETFFATPDVPFGFTVKKDTSIDHFESALKEFFGEQYEKMEKWLRNAANKRNMLLYASPAGIPKVKFNDAGKYFCEYENKINLLMLLYFLIAPYKEKQLFVQQALHAFVKMIGKMPDEEKLMEMINEIDKAPIAFKVDLNTGRMTEVDINGLIIKEIEFIENDVNLKLG